MQHGVPFSKINDAIEIALLATTFDDDRMDANRIYRKFQHSAEFPYIRFGTIWRTDFGTKSSAYHNCIAQIDVFTEDLNDKPCTSIMHNAMESLTEITVVEDHTAWLIRPKATRYFEESDDAKVVQHGVIELSVNVKEE